jgi:hypothetical protein
MSKQPADRIRVASAGCEVEGGCFITIKDIDVHALVLNHPFEAVKTSHLSRGMNRGHAILCTSIEVSFGLLD